MKKEQDKGKINTVLRKVLFVNGIKSIFFLAPQCVGWQPLGGAHPTFGSQL